MLITNGTVVTAEENVCADVRIEGERITEVGPALALSNPNEEVIDASGLLVMPGAVDAHTHMDLLVGGLWATDSFLTGTIAAACGGTTTIIDHMAFGPTGCNLQHQIDIYHGLADNKAVIDYGFHGVVSHVDDAILAEMAHLEDEGITSLKFYMTYDNRLDDEAIIRLLTRTRELGLLACVHCESHAMLTWLREKFVAQGKTAPRFHALSRPASCEAEAVYRVLTLAHVAGDAPLYLVHMSSRAAIEAARTVSFTPQVTLETCPQYLVLEDSLYGGDTPEEGRLEGLKYMMSPPLRKPSDQAALWEAVADGRISVIGTDHCPFNYSPEKLLGKDDFTKCPNGLPGIELWRTILYSEGVVKRGIDVKRIVEVSSAAPAKRFGLYPRKGTIAVGSDADIVLFDPYRSHTVTHSTLHEHVDYTPYEGLSLIGQPVMTLSRGEVIVKDGVFLGATGRGHFLKRMR